MYEGLDALLRQGRINWDCDFDEEAFWAKFEFKKWVVILSSGSGKKEKQDRHIIQARTKERAIACAKRHSLLKGRIDGTAWLARPSDLGCTPTQASALI